MSNPVEYLGEVSEFLLEQSGQTLMDSTVYSTVVNFISNKAERDATRDKEFAIFIDDYQPPDRPTPPAITIELVDQIDNRTVLEHVLALRSVSRYHKPVTILNENPKPHKCFRRYNEDADSRRIEIGPFGSYEAVRYLGGGPSVAIETHLPSDTKQLTRRKIADVAYELRALERLGLTDLPKLFPGIKIGNRTVRQAIKLATV